MNDIKMQWMSYCLEKPFAEESFPFDTQTWVAKVHGKMFALIDVLSDENKINLKCEPNTAEELRAEYSCVLPGYHMSKKHWNTIHYDSTEINWKFVREQIDHSYLQVWNSLPKKIREL
jgi:predicted DNA-binding protein (MmcQ/YjbR family)